MKKILNSIQEILIKIAVWVECKIENLFDSEKE